MTTLRRIWTFTSFTLTEYVLSGRVLIELVATVLFWALFLRQYPVGLEQFFSLTGILTILMALYTMASLLNLGDRPQGYVILTRPLGRAGYLLSLFAVALIVVTAMFAIITMITLLYHRYVFQQEFDWGVGELLKGALPLLLNVGLVAGLMLLLSSLVMSNTLRLVVLAALAVALYSQAWHLWDGFRFVEPLQSIFSWPIYPAIAGFRLATTRDFSGGAVYVLVAQLALVVLLVSLAVISFGQRDVILRNQ